jgi:CO dehydrogenase/acetyl-CoA synthase delta subunit
MTGLQLQACSVALARFKSDESHANIANYKIAVKEYPTEFEVVFIPNQPSVQDGSSKSRQITVGGETAYGREVHYFIAKATYQVLRRSFAR